MRRPDLQRFLDELVGSGMASAAAALVGTPEEIEWQGAAGWARASVPATVATRFDFASLTKPFAATLALVLDAQGLLPLALPVGEVWPEANRKLARKTLESLLRHRAGLVGWTPLYHRCRSWPEALSLLLDESLIAPYLGRYSDLDFILWGVSAERRLDQPLTRLLRACVLEPLGLRGVVPVPGDRRSVAESRMDTHMEVELAAAQGLAIEPLGPPPLGWPQDGNARFLHRLGKLAGVGRGLTAHAGLFGRVEDLRRLGAEWLEPGKLLQPEAVAAALGGGGPFALGWRRRTLRGSAGRALDPASFGHTGFAGGSLWIDPRKRRIVALLSHRTEPASDMNRWRRRFHNLALAPRRG